MSNVLVGKIINEIKIAEDRLAILFITSEGNVKAKCDGDCCSQTWIEHLELPALGFPARVISVRDLDMPNTESCEDEDEVVKYYGCEIVTNKGSIIIDYRNSSNGYYGGNLYWPDDVYYDGGVYGQNKSKENWISVIEDI